MMSPVECGKCNKKVMPIVSSDKGHKCPTCGNQINDDKIDDVL